MSELTDVGAGYSAMKNSPPVDNNPKRLMGDKKVPVSAVPPIAIAHEACALLDGELKYGYRNWIENPISARTYIDAAQRHINAWAEKEEVAPDSGVHHLGHARACLALLLDCQERGTLIDDRKPGPFATSINKLHDWVVERRRKHAQQQSAK